MTISIGTEKAFDKMQQAFMIKVLDRIGLQETNLSKIKVPYVKHTANTIINEEKF